MSRGEQLWQAMFDRMDLGLRLLQKTSEEVAAKLQKKGMRNRENGRLLGRKCWDGWMETFLFMISRIRFRCRNFKNVVVKL